MFVICKTTVQYKLIMVATKDPHRAYRTEIQIILNPVSDFNLSIKYCITCHDNLFFFILNIGYIVALIR